MLGGFKVPGPVKSILVQEMKKWGSDAVTVTASGLFPVERALALSTPMKVFGADTTLLAFALGSFYSGGKVEVELAEDFSQELGWLRPFMETPVGRLATVMLMKDLALSWMKQDQNVFYARVCAAYRTQFPDLHAKQVARLEATDFKLAGFSRKPVLEALHDAPEGHGLVLVPPQPLGPDKHVQALFGWPETGEPWLMGQMIEAVDLMRSKTDHWAVLTFGDEIHGLEDHLVGRAQLTNRGIVNRVYAGRHESAARLAMPRQELAPCLTPRLAEADEITPESTISIRHLSQGEFASLRSQYLNRNIKPGATSYAYGVLVDGKLAGVFAFVMSNSKASWRGKVPYPCVYQLSDFPVDPTQYPRLAKLIVYAAASAEAKAMAEQDFKQKINSVVTTAFSRKPVSMKYRGIYELLGRKQIDSKSAAGAAGVGMADAPPHSRSYDLNYGQAMGKWTLKEGLATWCKKHSVKGERPEAD